MEVCGSSWWTTSAGWRTCSGKAYSLARQHAAVALARDNTLRAKPASEPACAGTVTVAASFITLAVEDTGSGFGLRLSIAQAIARAHGSAITATSTEGAGSRFSLTLKC